MPARREPFDVRLSADTRDELARWLARELDKAEAARSVSDIEIAYWHTPHEQGRTRSARTSPWPDAADLTSAITTEKVDALRSRVVKTIFVDPVFTVEGFGDAATRAPFVEEFTQWQLESSGFQSSFSRVVHLALIEPCGVMEVYEETIRRPVRRVVKAMVEQDATGAVVLDQALKPIPRRDASGRVTPVEEGTTQPDAALPYAEIEVDDYEVIAHGPRERSIAYRDFLVLPGHAREKSEIWGYAKRFWRRVDELRERATAGVYLAEAVEALGTDHERASVTTLAEEPKSVVPAEDGLAEKQLWEVLFLKDLDGRGLRWYVATVHKDKQQLLRVQYDDIGRPRYFLVVPFPRPDSVEGYSFVGHKLITVIEENTAWRNMLADRASLQLQAPIKRLESALWDPEEEPIGPKAVITVRDMNEVQAFQLPDYTSPARERIIDTERQAEKLGGMSDIASGTSPNEDRTLGETRLVAANSEIRIEEVIRNIQETLEEVAQVRHVMWTRRLEAMAASGEDEGIEVPASVLQGLETRGADVSRHLPNRRLSAALMRGPFRFKPKGSVENANPDRQRFDFNQSLQALAMLSQANPMIGAILQSPGAAKALLEQWVRLFRVPDKQAFLGSAAMDAMRAAMAPPTPPMLPGGMPGAPPGPPPVAGPSGAGIGGA